MPTTSTAEHAPTAISSISVGRTPTPSFLVDITTECCVLSIPTKRSPPIHCTVTSAISSPDNRLRFLQHTQQAIQYLLGRCSICRFQQASRGVLANQGQARLLRRGAN